MSLSARVVDSTGEGQKEVCRKILPIKSASIAVLPDQRKTQLAAFSHMHRTNGTHVICQKHKHQQAGARYDTCDSKTAAAALECAELEHAACLSCMLWRILHQCHAALWKFISAAKVPALSMLMWYKIHSAGVSYVVGLEWIPRALERLVPSEVNAGHGPPVYARKSNTQPVDAPSAPPQTCQCRKPGHQYRMRGTC